MRNDLASSRPGVSWMAILALVPLLAAAGVASWLAVAGPRAVEGRARDALVAEQRLLAAQGAARISAALQDLSGALADPALRGTTGIEGASGREQVDAALGRFRADVLGRFDAVLLVHDASGKVVGVDPEAPPEVREHLLGHDHTNQGEGWPETGGAGFCLQCCGARQTVSVVSPLRDGWFLAANVRVWRLARATLESLFVGAERGAWLIDAAGEGVHGAGLDEPPDRNDPRWIVADAALTGPAAGWTVRVAARADLLSAGVASSATRLLHACAGIVILVLMAMVLLFLAQRRRHRRDLASVVAIAHQEKLATLGGLSAGVGHEVRNAMSVLVGNLDVAAELPRDSEAFDEAMQDVRVAADRVLGISDSLRVYSRRDGTTREPRPLSATVEEALRLLRPTLRAGPVVRVEMAGDPVVRHVPGQLVQVVVNLVKNAAEAMGREGTVTVRCERSGATARLVVEDEGPGIAADVRGRLFTPFVTTKADGTGLGLSVCAGLIEAHGGRITAGDGPGRGARFVVELPAEPEPAQPAVPEGMVAFWAAAPPSAGEVVGSRASANGASLLEGDVRVC